MQQGSIYDAIGPNRADPTAVAHSVFGPMPERRATSLLFGNPPEPVFAFGGGRANVFASWGEANPPKEVKKSEVYHPMSYKHTIYMKTCSCTGKKEEHVYDESGYTGLSNPPCFVGRKWFTCTKCNKETPYKDPPPPPPTVIDLDERYK